MSPFFGDTLEWSNWYAESRTIQGNNRWLAIAEKDMSLFLTESEHSVGDALYWQLAKAVAKGSLKSTVSEFEPRKGENFGDGRGAWQAIVNRFDTETQISLQADGWDDMMRNLQFTPKNGKTIAKHVSDFNTCCTEMEKIGRGDDYSPERLRTKFMDSIIDKEYDHVLLDAQTRRLSLFEVQETLVA